MSQVFTKMPIPRWPLLLAILGLIPFFIGMMLSNVDVAKSQEEWLLFGMGDNGADLVLNYSKGILCFLGGILFGFALTQPKNLGPFFLSFVPFFLALLAFQKWALIIAFVFTLAIDYYFQRMSLAPQWWLKLRLPISLAAMLLIGLTNGL